MKNKENRMVILQRGIGPRYERQFFAEIEKAVLNGYRIADTGKREDMSMRNFRGKWGRAVLYKEGFESVNKIELEETKSIVEVTFEEPTEDVEVVFEVSVEPAEAKEDESVKEVATQEVILKELKEAPNKDVLKELAEKHNLEVDPNKKHPEALRKALIAQVESKDSIEG